MKHGFTLLELLLVTLFLAIIGIYTGTYLRSTFKTQTAIEEKTSIQQDGMAIINRLREDISQVFFVDSYQKLTFFNCNAHELNFTTLSHNAPNPQDRESDQAQISYALEPDPDNMQIQILTRKEVPFINGELEKNDEYKPLVVASRISSLEFSYSDDGSKFVDTWNITMPDHLGKLPAVVKVNLTLRDPQDHEEVFETQIDLPMTQDLNLQAATSANPSPNGPTPPGTPGQPGTTPGQPGSNPNGTTPGVPNQGAFPSPNNPVNGGQGGVRGP